MTEPNYFNYEFQWLQDVIECPLEEQVLVGELDISTFSMQSLCSTQSDLRLRSLQVRYLYFVS